MDIVQAIKKATMQKRGITRKSWGPNPIWIIPNDTTSGMILANRKDELIAKWQPSTATVQIIKEMSKVPAGQTTLGE